MSNLQQHAFEIYKSKDITVEEAYDLAYKFLQEVRSEDNLKKVTVNPIMCSESPNLFGEVRFHFDSYRGNEFKIEDLIVRGVRYKDVRREDVVEYVITEINKQLKEKGEAIETVEVKAHRQ